MTTYYIDIGGRSGDLVSRAYRKLADPNERGQTTHEFGWVVGNDGNTYLIVPDDFEDYVHPNATEDAFSGIYNASLRTELRDALVPLKGKQNRFYRLLDPSLWAQRKTRDELVAAGILLTMVCKLARCAFALYWIQQNYKKYLWLKTLTNFG